MNRSIKKFLRSAFNLFAMAIVLVALPLLVGQHGVRTNMKAFNTPPPQTFIADLPAAPAHDPSLPTAVIILGDGITETSDFLAPYELLADSGLYNLYAVADQRRVHTMFPGGLDLIPHYSTAEYDAAVGLKPDVIVLPYMEVQNAVSHEALMNWVRDQWQADNLLVTICGGSQVAAEAGLLDGRTATSHQSILRVVRNSQPQVEWIEGVRYFDDGNLVSSAGVTSGVDAILHVIRREFDRDAALDVASAISYPHTHYLDDPHFQVGKLNLAAPLLNAAFSPSAYLGLVLFDGTSELVLAAISDLYPRTFTLQLRTITRSGSPVVTRHGLILVPDAAMGDMTELDRIYSLGNPTTTDQQKLEDWAEELQLPVEIQNKTSYPYDAILEDLAGRHSLSAARFAANGLEYPINHLALAGPPISLAPLLSLIGLTLPGLAAVISFIYRRGRRRMSA